MIATANALPSLEEIERLNAEFETAEAQDILRWAIETYSPRIAVTSSFGASSGAILHMISQIDRNVPVVFLQTHYHFAETLKLRDEIADRYGLTVENWEAWGGRPNFLNHYPDDLNKQEGLEGYAIPEAAAGKVHTGIDLCCWINKVEPLQRALRNRLAYITALRRDGGSEVRKRTRILEVYKRPDTGEFQVKVNPMANWDKKRMWRYIHDNDIPVHELWSSGYKSIGCAPCTLPSGNDGDERSGRWSGTVKTECGIHTAQTPVNYSI
ncbi:MAG: phosphoadenosine phosphosulfate reductase [Candidatus Sumerlaeota bacterium]|nr:phosphoadenosine phosphosulfate reductase [Candidatus Sumerlaeota bacterium]